MTRQHKIFRNLRYVRRRDGSRAYRVEVIHRGTGTMMYSTPRVATEIEAQERAKQHVKRRGYIDTTMPRIGECPSCLKPAVAGHSGYCVACWTEKAINS